MSDLRARNRKILSITLGVVFLMIAMAYASVPLYRVFCKVTGWGGTTQTAKVAPHQSIDRKIKIRFSANVARDMPWDFKPDITEVEVKIGQDAIVSFTAENKTKAPITGTAVYNVTPLQAGKYFFKTQCFCFGQQVLAPGQKVHMPVTFYVDPKIADDRDMDDVHTITLSYTFFRENSTELQKATGEFTERESRVN